MGAVSRVLVVEDDPVVCRLIENILREVRLTAVCAHGEGEAYRLIPTLPTIRALVVDVNLGSAATGFDVARFARQVIPGLPVIYVTGQVSRAAFEGLGVPDGDYLPKPFRVDELLAKLAAMLRSVPLPG